MEGGKGGVLRFLTQQAVISYILFTYSVNLSLAVWYN